MEQNPHGEQAPKQWFQFGAWLFDVDKAQALLAKHPREPEAVPVAPWARQYGLDLIGEPGAVPILGVGPDFDREYAMTTDLHEPVIVATLHHPERGDSALLIDGTHRLYRAYQEGIAELPGYVLNVCGRPRNSPWDERRIDKALSRSQVQSNRESATSLMDHPAPPCCCF